MSILHTQFRGTEAFQADPSGKRMSTFLGRSLGTQALHEEVTLHLLRVTGGVDFLWAGKSHLCRAATHHEESMREASLCKKLRNIEVLQEVLSAARQRSQLKYSQLREDDDLLNLTDAPDIVCEWRGCQCRVCCMRGRAAQVLLLPWSPYLLTLRSGASFMVFFDPLVTADPLLPLISPPVMSGSCHLGCAPTFLPTLR